MDIQYLEWGASVQFLRPILHHSPRNVDFDEKGYMSGFLDGFRL